MGKKGGENLQKVFNEKRGGGGKDLVINRCKHTTKLMISPFKKS